MEEDFKVIDNYLMIRMPEEIDHHNSVDISQRADRYIVSKKVGNVVFDFERTISCFGGKVYAVNAGNRIRRLLLLSGLENIVELIEK